MRLLPGFAAIVVACGSHSSTDDTTAIVSSVDFQVSPASLSFGAVPCGETAAPQLVTIRNTGGAALDWSVQLADGTPFVLQGAASGLIGSGESATVSISASPTASGDAIGSATVVVGGLTQEVPLSARGSGAQLVADPPLVDFGEVRFDHAFSRDVVLRNVGDRPAVVARFDGAADAIDLSWLTAPSPIAIDPGQAKSFVATVHAGSVTGTPAEAKLTPIVSTSICGAPPIVDVRALRSNTNVTLSTADFGPRPCLGPVTDTRDVVITNYAQTALTYTASLPSTSPFRIAAGATGSVPPADANGAGSAAVSIATNAANATLDTPGVLQDSLALSIGPLAPPDGGMRTAAIRLDVRGAVITVDRASASFQSDGRTVDQQTFRFTNQGNEQIRIRYAVQPVGGAGNVWSIDAPIDDVPPASSRDAVVYFFPGHGPGAQFDAVLGVTRDSGAAACKPLPQPQLTGVRN